MSCIGILALQGGYRSHQKKIYILGHDCVLIKNFVDLEKVDALVLPGGESTTMIYLLEKYHLWNLLKKKVADVPVLATCAGLILLQKLGALDIDIVRNGYGHQLNSKILKLTVKIAARQLSILDGFFIRAPIVKKIHDPAIEVLSYYQKSAVLVRKDNIIGATFHPELSSSITIHEYFITRLV